jgi:RNA polymerase primary sigma factor
MREDFIREHMYLVQMVARKTIHHSNLPMEDLIQEGCVGLMVAAEKFDPTRGCKFATYAAWWIKQAMFKAISEQSHCMKIPVYVQETLSKYSKIRREMEQANAEVKTADVAARMDVPADKIEAFLSAYSKTISIEGALENEMLVAEIIPDERVTAAQKAEFENLKHDIEVVVSTLKSRERDVIRLRFGLEDSVKHTLEEIGNLYGVTKECIRQTEARALNKMRDCEMLAAYAC